MNDYYGTENYGPAGPPEGNKSSATTEPELIDDERYARAVANQGKQVTALSMRCAELESERAALEADLVRLRIDHSRLQVVLWTLLNELSPAVVEELRAVWGNTNTRILEDRIEDARRALDAP